MTINYLELTETEEDFTGINRANLISDELHEFTSSDERIFSPDLGQFYLNKQFQIVDANNGRPLLQGIDYNVEYFSKRVFSKSGLDNAYLIHVFNLAVTSVRVTYQCVGGLYTSPAYLITMMMEKYPDGIGPIIYWKNVLFKPDQFVPAGHRHHALEIYALSPMVDSLERVRGGLADKDRIKFASFYDNTLNRFNDLMTSITNGYNGLLSTFQETRKSLELQQGDFIYTDSTADQTTLRKYGKWKQHTNTMLAAGGPTNAGTSMSVGSGYTNPVRRTNLYQRIDDPWGQGADLVEKTLLLQASSTSFNEGDTITIDIIGVNIPPLTQVTGNYVGISADNVKDGNLYWQATLDAFGKATITLETVANSRTTGNIEIIVLPEQFATAAISLLMMDTSKTPTYNLFFSSDAQGLNRITRANEGAVMYMNLIVNNPILNESLALNYSAGSASQTDFITQLPASLVVPSNGIVRVRLETKNDERAENEEVFVASVLPLGSIDLGAAKARAEIIISDTSYQAAFNAVFSTDTSGVGRITEINEGQTFYLYATTSLPNGTVVNFEYGGTMQLDDFSDRPLTAIVSEGTIVAGISTRSDARTDGDKILGLSIKRTNGVTLANLSLIVRDTSQAPETTIYFTDTNGGTNPVTEFNEGQTIYITIITRNVENGTYLDLSYNLDGAITQAEINQEFTAPLPVRVPVSNNRAIIAATILEDYKADQNRNFRCILELSGASAFCIVRDTSVPVASAKFNNSSSAVGVITEANEGQTIYLVVETKGYASGTVLALNYTGNVSDDDFTVPRPKSISVSSTGVSIVSMTVKNDFVSEGIENMRVSVISGGTELIAMADLVIRDTSLTPTLGVLLASTNTVSTPITNINEGVTAFIHLSWTNLPLNVVVNWEIVNITTANSDFSSVSGSVVSNVYNGGAIEPLTTVLDRTTEGSETFRILTKVTLPNGQVISSQSSIITLLDTSITELFSVGYCATATDGPYIGTVNEGTAVYLIVKGTNIPNGTLFNLSLPSTGTGFVNDQDVTPVITGTDLTMDNNFIAHRLNITSDRLTEGDETLIVRVTRKETNVPHDATIVVVDTSVTADIAASLYLANGTKPLNNEFKEGETGYLLLTYSKATIGDRFRPTLPAGASNVTLTDFTSSEFGVEKITIATSGTLRWDFVVKSDRTTEGDKNFNVTLSNLTTVVNYPLDGTYKILDTSKTTTYTKAGWYNLADTAITQSPEGVSVNCQVLPVDGVIGDVYRLTIVGGTAVLNQDFQVNSADIVYNTNGMTIKWLFNLLPDRITESNETVICSITNTTTGQVCGSWSLTITDTSLTPTAALGYWNSPASFGGNAITVANEGQNVWFRLGLANKIVGDKWRISIAPNSAANAADIGNYVTEEKEVLSTTPEYLETQFLVTMDERTEGNENLVLQVEFQAVGTATWVNKGSSSLVITDTSKTPTFDVYYANDAAGVNRITSIGEGTTAYLIAKTTNVATGTVLQVGFTGSTVNSADFSTASPYVFPTDINTLVPMTVQSNGIAYYRFDIKADLLDG